MLALLAAVLLRQVPLAWMVKAVVLLQTVQLVALLQVAQLVGQAVQPGVVSW
jgi:hypothetical protein